MTPKRKHELSRISLIAAQCACGWRFYLENLKGKTDEDLAAETYHEFEEHKRLMK